MIFLTLIAVAAAQAEPPFLERFVLAIAGPAVGALLGTGVIGLLVWKVTDRVQRRRAETQLKLEVLTAAFTVAAKWSLEINRFGRLKSDASASEEEKKKARTALDKQYMDCRSASLVLEARLEAIFEAEDPVIDFKSKDAVDFESRVPAIEWHKVNDLLTVRYMRATGRATYLTYETYAKGYEDKLHTGMTEGDLEDDDLLYSTYRKALTTLKHLLLTTKVVQTHGRRRFGEIFPDRPGNGLHLLQRRRPRRKRRLHGLRTVQPRR